MENRQTPFNTIGVILFFASCKSTILPVEPLFLKCTTAWLVTIFLGLAGYALNWTSGYLSLYNLSFF